ncbi:hypothetical protein PInf_004543 [Phytophthora infestans]|nr:hypothetical protein PInf_004543 [Phytophthora infestans]
MAVDWIKADKLASAESAAKVEKRVGATSTVTVSEGRANGIRLSAIGFMEKLFQGKFQIEADRVDELGSGYECINATALV